MDSDGAGRRVRSSADFHYYTLNICNRPPPSRRCSLEVRPLGIIQRPDDSGSRVLVRVEGEARSDSVKCPPSES